MDKSSLQSHRGTRSPCCSCPGLLYYDTVWMDISNYERIVSAKITEIKSRIASGNVTALPEWDLSNDFEAFFAPYYLRVLSINGSLSMLLHMVVWYVFVNKTPKDMRYYRWFLFNISICSFIHDVQFSVLWRPVPLFPKLMGFTTGTARFLGPSGGHFGMVASVASVGIYVSSMLVGCVYRMVSLMNRKYYHMVVSWKGAIVLLFFQVTPSIVASTLVAYSYVPVAVLKEKTLTIYPQLEPIFQSEYIFGYDPDYNPTIIYLGVCLIFCVSVFKPILELICVGTIIYQLKRVQACISLRTYKMHKNLLLALGVQILLPNLMIMYPAIVLIIGAWKQWSFINILFEATIMSCSIHSVLDNLVTLVVIKPYRTALMKWVFGRKMKMPFMVPTTPIRS